MNDEDKQAVERNPDLVGECERRSRLAEQMKMEYGSALKAKGTDLSAEYARLNTYVRNLRNKLRQDAFNAKRQAYFEGIDTHIIEQQLQGLCSQKFEVGDEQKVDFSFDERIRLAHNLFLIGSEENENIIYSRRLEVIADWVLLCNLRSPRNRKLSTDAAMSPDDVTDPAIFPIKCPGTQCLFCLGDTQLTVGARTYCFLILTDTNKLTTFLTCHHQSPSVVLTRSVRRLSTELHSSRNMRVLFIIISVSI